MRLHLDLTSQTKLGQNVLKFVSKHHCHKMTELTSNGLGLDIRTSQWFFQENELSSRTTLPVSIRVAKETEMAYLAYFYALYVCCKTNFRSKTWYTDSRSFAASQLCQYSLISCTPKCIYHVRTKLLHLFSYLTWQSLSAYLIEAEWSHPSCNGLTSMLYI